MLTDSMPFQILFRHRGSFATREATAYFQGFWLPLVVLLLHLSFKNLSLHFNFSLALSSPSLTLPQFLVQCPNTLCASNLFWKAASTLIKSLWLFADLGRSAQMLQNSEKSGPVLLRVGVEVTLFQATDRCLCLSARRRFLSCSSTIWTYNVRNRTTFKIFTNRLVFRSGFNS